MEWAGLRPGAPCPRAPRSRRICMHRVCPPRAPFAGQWGSPTSDCAQGGRARKGSADNAGARAALPGPPMRLAWRTAGVPVQRVRRGRRRRGARWQPCIPDMPLKFPSPFRSRRRAAPPPLPATCSASPGRRAAAACPRPCSSSKSSLSSLSSSIAACHQYPPSGRDSLSFRARTARRERTRGHARAGTRPTLTATGPVRTQTQTATHTHTHTQTHTHAHSHTTPNPGHGDAVSGRRCSCYFLRVGWFSSYLLRSASMPANDRSVFSSSIHEPERCGWFQELLDKPVPVHTVRAGGPRRRDVAVCTAAGHARQKG